VLVLNISAAPYYYLSNQEALGFFLLPSFSLLPLPAV
jgi:hypothetical protein